MGDNLQLKVYCNDDIRALLPALTDDRRLAGNYGGGLGAGFTACKSLNLGDLGAICSSSVGGIPATYVHSHLYDPNWTNLIIIQYDTEQDKTGNVIGVRGVRGFTACLVGKNPEVPGHYQLRVQILCNKDLMYALRSRTGSGGGGGGGGGDGGDGTLIVPSGENLLKATQCLGFDVNGDVTKSSVVLFALESVITYYHKFGWRFIRRCDEEEGVKRTSGVKALFAYYKSLKGAQPDDDAIAHIIGESGIQSYAENIHNVQKMQKAQRDAEALKREEDEDPDEDESKEQYREDSVSSGFRMLWCPEKLPATSLVNPAGIPIDRKTGTEFTFKGGKRRRISKLKKKTKKKTKKKKGGRKTRIRRRSKRRNRRHRSRKRRNKRTRRHRK